MLLWIRKTMHMQSTERTIRFLDNGSELEVRSSVRQLTKVQGREFLVTRCGLRIALDHILSFNGVALV